MQVLFHVSLERYENGVAREITFTCMLRCKAILLENINSKISVLDGSQWVENDLKGSAGGCDIVDFVKFIQKFQVEALGA